MVIFSQIASTIAFPTTSTVGISFTNAQTGTIGAAISALPGITSTVNIGTTGTVGLSGHTTSTIPTTGPSQINVTTMTSTTSLVGTTASTLVIGSTSTNYVKIQNVTITGTIYLRHAAVPTTTNFDTMMTYRDVYEINQTNLWKGDINAISLTITSSVALLGW